VTVTIPGVRWEVLSPPSLPGLRSRRGPSATALARRREPKLSAPARRALSGAGYARLDQLAEVSESDLRKPHGMGPTAIEALRAALEERGLSFRR
jgi:hypothetical protein